MSHDQMAVYENLMVDAIYPKIMHRKQMRREAYTRHLGRDQRASTLERHDQIFHSDFGNIAAIVRLVRALFQPPGLVWLFHCNFGNAAVTIARIPL